MNIFLCDTIDTAWKSRSKLKQLCAWCNQAKDDNGNWHKISDPMELDDDSTVTHGICPDCEESLMRTAENL